MSRRGKNRSGTVDETFPYQVCINLDRRLERWGHMQQKFAQHGIRSVRRFSALDGEKMSLPANWAHTAGAYGCLLSHLQVVSEARRLGIPQLLIFEDDVAFDDQFVNRFAASIGQLPADWDMLFFGALHRDEPVRISENIARITQANSTFACALRSTVFDAFIELNRKTEDLLDSNSLLLQKRFKCYCFMPHLAWVETDHSDAQQRLVDHWYLRESLVLYGPQVDRLLSETTIVFAHRNPGRSADVNANLRYLLSYYHHYFSPFLAMIVVEQGAEPTVDRAALPANCKYMLLPDAKAFDREGCFQKGIAAAEPGRKRVILSDNDIYLEPLDIRANLRMCERYDYVTGFRRLFDLNHQDSTRLRGARWPEGIDFMKNGSRDNAPDRVCMFVNREVTQASAERSASLFASLAQADRVFQSPNHALRLHQGTDE